MIDRRQILRAAGVGMAIATAGPLRAQERREPSYPPIDDRSVWLVGDDRPRSATELSQRLSVLAAANTKPVDAYLGGGAVAELEASFANLLGKEDCAFLPTGTMANTVAVRVLTGKASRILCQADSHLYRDESDAVQRLSGLNLVPLASGGVTPTIAELNEAFDAAEKGPYPLRIGAVSLESPVRRQSGEMIAPADLGAIATLARQHGARLHLDGARLLLAPPTLDVRAYVVPFDTVYVSLYKYLGAPFGAVLAGSKADIDAAREWRHIEGGLIHQGWLPAILATDGLATFPAEIAKAHAMAAELIAELEKRRLARRRSTPCPSNIYLLEMPQERAALALDRGREKGIRVGRWADGAIPLYVNTTILRRESAEYVRLFA